jgi:hypothetical protein
MELIFYQLGVFLKAINWRGNINGIKRSFFNFNKIKHAHYQCDNERALL